MESGQTATAPLGARPLHGGQPLSAPLRAFFESRLGRDLGNVRIHTDARAARAAREIDARAYTLGRDVVFGAGEYQPDTDSGRRLLAHELVHVVQQSIGTAPAVPQRKGRTRWRDDRALFYKTKGEAQNQIDFVKSLGKSELLGFDGAIKVDPAGPVQEKEGWSFFYFPLTQVEAEAAKLAAEAKLGRKDVLTVERSERAQSFFIQPRCPDAAPDETGWTRWAACFPTEREATRQVKKFQDAHIEAKTGRLQEDRYYVLFQPLTEAEAKAKGEAEAKTRSGFAEGMFTVETTERPELKSHTYRLRVDCPKGFKKLDGLFKITSYFIADESQFPEKPTEKDPCGLKGVFREQFLHKTKGKPPFGVDMEGSGRTLAGKTINVVGEGCYKEAPQPLGKSNRPLTVGSSVAVDKKKIPIGSQVLIEDVGLRVADDVGGGIKGNEIDVYKGPFDKTKDTTLHNKLVCLKEKP